MRDCIAAEGGVGAVCAKMGDVSRGNVRAIDTSFDMPNRIKTLSKAAQMTMAPIRLAPAPLCLFQAKYLAELLHVIGIRLQFCHRFHVVLLLLDENVLDCRFVGSREDRDVVDLALAQNGRSRRLCLR